MRFYLVDAFTEKIFGGNPAGVVIVEDEGFPSIDIMLKTAAELRYSETVFIKYRKGNVYELRYFTPTAEVELCGHATIAAFSVIGTEKRNKKKSRFSILTGNDEDFHGCGCYFRHDLDENGLPKIMSNRSGKTYKAITKAGEININVDDGTVMMDMVKPETIKEINSTSEINRMRNILGLCSKEKFAYGDLSPAIITTGLPDIIFPVEPEELDRIDPDMKALSDLSKSEEVVGLHAFSLSNDNEKVEIDCRNFAPLFGIPEEAATGTANGALTYYLYNKKIIKENVLNTIVQGKSMGRPSRVSSLLEKDNDKSITVKVGGSAVVLCEGEINI